MILKTWFIKENVDNHTSSKLKTLAPPWTSLREWKDWCERIFTSHISDKELVTRIQNNSQNQRIRKQPHKNGQRFEQTLHQEDRYMDDK